MKRLTVVVFLLFAAVSFAVEEFQPVNPEFKLVQLKGGVELYTSDEAKLYEYDSPHGHFYAPQGWGHSEELTVDLRRIKVDLGIIDYVPVYFGLKFKTFPYSPYADSLQLVSSEAGLMIPLFARNFNFRFAASPQSWSGHQVSEIEYGLIWQTNFGLKDKQYDYYFWNIGVVYHQNSFLSLIGYIDDNVKWHANKAILADVVVDTRALDIGIYCGYRLDYRWNDDGSNGQITDIKFMKHAIVLGNSSRVSDDLDLTYEGSWEWSGLVTLARVKAMLTLRTNLY